MGIPLILLVQFVLYTKLLHGCATMLETRKLSPVRKSASFGDVEQVQVIEEIEESEVL